MERRSHDLLNRLFIGTLLGDFQSVAKTALAANYKCFKSQ